LDWNATDRTALQRLAQIALSTGEYPQALTWMQTAWEAGHRDEITRLLLGDALAAAGKPFAAAEMVRGLPWAAGRLNTQAWYRYVRQQDYARAAFAWQAVLSLDPNDTHALSGMQFLQQP
jgi:tetratricopeptide (TPR) repeat protein